MKRSLLGLILLSLCLLGCGQAPAQGTADQAGLPPIEVYFSPKGGCTEAVVKELGNAKTTVLVQAYSFTSAPIAKALFMPTSAASRSRSSWTRARGPRSTARPISSSTWASRPDRRQARHRPQQGHGHRRPDRHHGQLQFHHGRRREQRRESAGNPQSRTSLPSTRPTGRPMPHIRTRTKARQRATPKRTRPPQSRRRPTPLPRRSPADSWPRQDRRSSTGPIASRRPRFRLRTSCITPRGTRRSRPERSRVPSAIRRAWLPAAGHSDASRRPEISLLGYGHVPSVL